jgi:amidophosphoribosyltransferase
VARGDGRLNHELLPGEKGPQDACGVFGVWAPGEEVAKLTYYGLYALQHRGQESAGIATSDGNQVLVYKDMGLVSQVFSDSMLDSLHGHIAIGHARYSTTGSSVWENAQPTFRTTATGHLALGHNGNLTNTHELAERLETLDTGELPLDNAVMATSDTDLIAALFAAHPGKTIEQAALAELPALRGAFSLVFLDDHTLYAARDPQGIRPLSLGRLERGWVVASETAALDIVGASFVRDIEPGEFVAIDENGVRSSMFAQPSPKGCLFEYVYLARPDSVIDGHSIHGVRAAVGRKLAREAPADADIVVPVPDSGLYAAMGYSRESGLPFELGMTKNHYVGRTFIEPKQSIRNFGVKVKLNPVREHHRRQARGARSTTRSCAARRQRKIVRMMREAGAREVHLRISSPPTRWPCYYGIDFASRAELVAPGLSVDDIRRSIGADSLGYVSLDGLIEATGVAKDHLCRACFDGVYPVALADPGLRSKHILEVTG